MLRIGLTGSIGVGKSFVSSVFEDLGCHLLDADQTSREVVLPGTPSLNAVNEAFGGDVLLQDGTLDRQRLASIVFADEEKRLRLNAILHPYIIARQDEILREWEREDPEGIGIVDAAMMIESGGYRRFDKLIVVHCRPEVQLDRLIARDDLPPEEAARRIAAQMPQAEKIKFADFLIDTSEGFDSARAQTEAMFRELKVLPDKR